MTNITTIKFCGRLAQSAALYQYDYGQRLVFQNIELPQTYEVHFANDGDTETITMLGDVDGVLVPDELLLTGKIIKAYIYLHAGEDDGETEYCATIPVAARPEPSDVEPTPVQQNIIEQAIAKLTEAVEDYENITTATEEDEGKALTVKTVEDGKVTEWEFKTGGGGGGTTDYTDLDNKPKINNVTLTGNKTTADLGLFSGDYTDLTNKPTIPTKVSDLTNDAGYITSAPVASVNNQTGDVVLDADDVGAYSLPSGGIPKSDLASSVRTSLGKADTALQTAPVSSVDGKTGAVTILPSGGSTGQVLKKTSSSDYAVAWANESSGGTSDYTDLTNKPSINSVTLSGNKTSSDLGLLEPSDITASKSGDTTTIYVDGTAIAQVKDGTNGTDGHTPVKGTDYWTAQDKADIVQDVVDEVGIKTETVTGTTVSITGVANTRYICGEVSTISITPPQSGIIDVIFTSGSSVAVLTVPSTVKWPSGFDPTSLEANTTYELNIMDGVYGAVMTWT